MTPADKLAPPDFCYDANEWETTYEWGERFHLTDDAERNEILHVKTLIVGPDKWAAYIVTKRDEDGDELNGDWKWFDSEASAVAALAKAGRT